MKTCPACGKEYEDPMRFCQADGTALVAAQPLDPYATMIGQKLDLTPPEPTAEEKPTEPQMVAASPAEEQPMHQSGGSIAITEPDEVLEMPGADPLKTMYVSESELKEAFGTEATRGEAEPPRISPPASPPPSPFSASDRDAETVVASEPPPFKEPEPSRAAEWTPPDATWQNQPIAASAPYQPVSMSAALAPSQGLAIGSLVCGILSCLCCFSVLTGPAAVVMGFIAKQKAAETPSEYGGSGMALGGMITGAIGFLLGIVLIVLQVFFGVLGGLLGNMPR